MLKMTEIELKHISEIDIYLFIDKEMRGGICYMTKRCSKTNNKYMQSYENKKSIIQILSKNNLFISLFINIFIQIKTIYVVGQSVNIFPMVDLNG